MNWLNDTRTGCWSVLTNMQVAEYLDLVKGVHSARGNITGQRDVLKTTTGKRIRERMVSDIQKGAVLPPIVIGVIMDPASHLSLPNLNAATYKDIGHFTELSIIDGMQRTESLQEAASIDPSVLTQEIRIEFWLANNVSALVYRMLVLNTGQVPWTVSRQISVVYGSLLSEIKSNVTSIERVLSIEKNERRVAPAQYQGDDLVELYLAFSLRKTTLDTKEALSEEFSRLDIVENVSDKNFQQQFFDTLSFLAQTDVQFSRCEVQNPQTFGKNIFDSQPARIGFVVAIGQHILGRSGQERSSDERQRRMDEFKKFANSFLTRLQSFTDTELGNFLRLDVLDEILNKKVGQVGRFERTLYFDAFKVLIDEKFEVQNLEMCWRAN